MSAPAAPRIGYAAAAEVVKTSLATGRSIADVAVKRGGLSSAEARRLLDPSRLTRPGRG